MGGGFLRWPVHARTCTAGGSPGASAQTMMTTERRPGKAAAGLRAHGGGRGASGCVAGRRMRAGEISDVASAVSAAQDWGPGTDAGSEVLAVVPEKVRTWSLWVSELVMTQATSNWLTGECW